MSHAKRIYLIPFLLSLGLISLRIQDSKKTGVLFAGAGTKGRLERCEIFGHTTAGDDEGIFIQTGASPTSISSCTIRDNGVGVFVHASSKGAVPGAETGNTFARNQMGSVTRG